MSDFDKTPKQRAAIDLVKRCKYTLLSGGSRSGKTTILCYAIAVRALKVKSRHVILRLRFIDVRTSVGMDTLPKLLSILNIPYKLNKADWVFTLPNGSEIWLAGLDDKERVEKILGKEYSTIYLNEASQVWDMHSYITALTRLAEKTTLDNKVYIDCNPPVRSHWLYSMFIKMENPDTKVPVSKPELYGYLDINPEDNRMNLPEGYIEETLSSLPERERARFRDGLWLEKRDGALWTRNVIEQNRVNAAPQLSKIVVGVDPAVTAHKTSDETGIVVVGVGTDYHLYVLADYSLKAKVEKWTETVVEAYHKHAANYVVGEVNQGGDLIETALRNVDRYIAYKSVRAVSGKDIRADPISLLYSRGMVHHVGYFPELEEQMIEWVPGDVKSPDRMDALVWACSELAISGPSRTFSGSPILSQRDGEMGGNNRGAPANRPSGLFTTSQRPPVFGRR